MVEEQKKVQAKKEESANNEPKMSNWQIFFKGLFKENGIFVLALGLCPALAVTTSLEGAIGMGLLITIVLTCTNMTVSLIRKLVPNAVRIPIYILIIASEVTIVKMLVDAFLPELADTLGLFIALITVNCIILGRAEAFASENGVGKSALDGLGVGLGCLIGLAAIGLVREFFGTGMIKFGYVFTFIPKFELFGNTFLPDYALSVLVNPPGAFLVIGFLLAGIAFYQQKRNAKKGDKK